MSEERDDRAERSELFGNTPMSAMPMRDVMKEDFGIEVPIDTVPLPSQGKVYPPGSVLHNLETVNIKAMTAKEEDMLTSRALLKQGTVLSHLLQSCVQLPGLNPDMLLSGDRNALMVALRITGYGADYRVEVTCPHCGEKQKHEFDLAEMPIKMLEIEPVHPGSNEFEYTLPKSGLPVKFRFMTGRDEVEMMKEAEKQKKIGTKTENLVTQRLIRSLVSVKGVTDPNKLRIFSSKMTAADSRALRDHINKHEPGIDMKGWLECNACYETSEVKLPFGASFFWPDTE